MKQHPGSWMDEDGACKVCGGEIPHGHTNECDIFKMEQRENELVELLRYVAHSRLPMGDTVIETLPEHWQLRILKCLYK